MKNYINDKTFLEKYLKLVELSDGKRRVALCPALQGRVLTSAADGDTGYSFGWLNYDLISSGKLLPHCNNWGGEDRFWLGPEGGQFSLFFPKDTAFAFEEWQTPAVIDTQAWELVSHTAAHAVFACEALFENTSGTQLCCRLERTVTLLEPENVPHGVESVAFRSENRLTNCGDFVWDKSTGMPSVWMLGQFMCGDQNTVVIPYRFTSSARINDSYFGKIGEDRLKIGRRVILFKADGKKRGKIGIPPQMAMPVAGAYDAEAGVLTVVKFDFDENQTEYVNSMWERQEHPFQGDVMNAYNDGPLEDGSMMGPFYELESSSPAAHLEPGESLVHSHTTMHFTGGKHLLDEIARKWLGVGLGEAGL